MSRFSQMMIVLSVAAASLLSVVSAQAGLYSAAVLSDVPVAYWRMGDADGSAVADASGNGHVGASDGPSVTFGGASLVPAEIGNGSVSLAGFDRIMVPGFEKIGPGGYTAEYWVKVTAYPTACCDNLVGDGESGGDFFMMNYLIGPGQGTTGVVRPHYGTTNAPVSLTGTAVLALDEVYHVVTTWDPTNANNANGKIYVNGVMTSSVIVSGNVPAPGTTGDNMIFIGRDGRENRPSNFMIDEVAMYNYALTAEQIESHYEIGINPIPEPGTMTLAVLGLLGLGAMLRRRRSRG